MSSKDQNLSNEQVLDQNIDQQPINGNENPAAEAEVDNAVNALQEQIALLEKQLTETGAREREIQLRAKAEIENMRRRAEQDIERAHKFALEKFATELLPVIDNLERAIEVADKNNPDLKPMTDGVELTLKSMLDVIHKFGMEVIDANNVPFNPEVHEAMTMLESAEHQPNHVMMIMQKGYLLNGRLIRPARVAVAK